MEFYIVDVFAEEKYAGNQLAVVRGAEGLADETMQKLALEMNYSETTFILTDTERDGGYDVRIFTPVEEVPFAGHPTLGTAYIIQQEIIGQAVEKVTLNLKVGQIPVQITYAANAPDVLWMHQKPPDFGETFAPEALAAVLNIEMADIDTRFPIQDVTTGLPFIIVPLRSRAAVKRARINLDKHDQFIADKRAKAFLIFCAEPYQAQNDLNARMFGPYFNVHEDPATGSANGCLAGYLVKHRYFGSDQTDQANQINIRVEQGYEIDRPSLLLLRAQAKAETIDEIGEIDVFVGGRVVPTAKGALI